MTKEIKILFSSRSETNLANELDLIDFVQQNGSGYLEQSDSKLLAEQVKYIYETEPNINTYREEQIGEIFHVDNWKKQHLILELIYFLVGKKHIADVETITLEKLDKWGDCVMQHGFYLGYQLSNEDIDRLLKGLPLDYIIRYSRDVNLRGREWEQACKGDFNEELSDDEIIGHINIYNDGAYTSLPESVDTILYYINRSQDHQHWLELYNLLTYVPLQGRLIYGIQTIEDCIDIIRAESKHNVHRRKVFAYLMRKRIFDLFIQEQDLLERNADNEYLSDEQRVIGESLLRDWNENKQGFAQYIVSTHWPIFFSADEMIVWLSVKYNQMQSMRGIYKKRHGETLQLIEGIAFDVYEFKGINIEDKPLATILYFISHVRISEKGQCGQIIQNICKKIYNEEHLYLFWQLDEDSLTQMRAAYTCLMNSELNGIEIVYPYISLLDANNTTNEQVIRTHQGNKWWLSVLMLKTEESESYEEFMEYANVLLKCAKKCQILLHEYYLLPFLVAEIIAMEIIREGKDTFEQRLINEIDDIIFVVSVLTINNGKLSEENKALLQRKVQEKWEASKKEATFNRNIEACERYIEQNC